jgi:hypothetical protein
MPKINISVRMIMYDFMYALGDKLFEIYNPCKITTHPTEGLICSDSVPCCNGCQYISLSGCTTKCLYCKLWLCWPRYDYPQYFLLGEQLRLMRMIGDRFCLLALRKPRSFIKSELVRYSTFCKSGFRVKRY